MEKFLSENNIIFIKHNHPAFFTCEDADNYSVKIPGISCKNLFLKNKNKTRFFLAILPAHKKIDTKLFSKMVNESKISFANDEILKEKMNLYPGSVSPFGLINNDKHDIELFIDEEIYNADVVGFHPNINTATLELSKIMFHKYLEILKNKFTIFKF